MRSPTDHYVREHPRSAVLWYQRDVPKDVRGLIGKTRWRKSLGTAIHADAIRKARRLAQEHDRLIDEVRESKIDPLTRLSDEERALIEEAGGVQDHLGWLNERAGEAQSSESQAELVRTLAIGDDPDSADPDWAAAEVAGLEAKRNAITRQIEQAIPTLERLGINETSLRGARLHSLADALVGARPERERLTLSGVVEKWVVAKKPGAPDQYRYPVRLFEGLHGVLFLSEITEDHVRAFRDKVREIPRSGGKHSKLADFDLHAMLALAEQDGLHA